MCLPYFKIEILIYFIVSGEISVYLVKIKVVSITSEMIRFLFSLLALDKSVFFIVSEVDVTATSDF